MDRVWLLSMVLTILSVETVQGQGMFVDRSSQLPPGTLQLNYGVAVTNVGDGDGPMEWVVAGYSGANIVLQYNETTGQYVNIAQEGTPYENLKDSNGAAIGVCACDIDGDGLEEIYFLNVNGYSGPKDVTMKDRLFKWRNGRYEDLFVDDANLAVSNMFNGRSVACVDRTGSGKYGFLLATYAQDYEGKFGLIEMDESDSRNDVTRGQIVLHNAAVSAGIDFTTGGRGITVGPILGDDGFSDIYFVNEGNYRLRNRGDNALFKNDGQGHFTNLAGSLNLADYEPGRGVALSDFNNDGKIDIVYGNWMGPHRLQIQGIDADGNTTFTNVVTSDFATASPIRTVIAADFDNSGELQVFMNNIYYRGINTNNRLFRIHPNGATVTIEEEDIGDAEEREGYGTGAAVSDINGDGVLELLISHGESRAQPLSFYEVSSSRSAGNNWLRILPLTRFDAPARGSKVTVTLEGGTRLTRVSDGGSGYLCEMEPVTHFGLGQSTAQEVKVTWPDGHVVVKRLTTTDINKMHKIAYSGEMTTIQGSSPIQQGGSNIQSQRSATIGGNAAQGRGTYGLSQTQVHLVSDNRRPFTSYNRRSRTSNRGSWYANRRRGSTAAESTAQTVPSRRSGHTSYSQTASGGTAETSPRRTTYNAYSQSQTQPNGQLAIQSNVDPSDSRAQSQSSPERRRPSYQSRRGQRNNRNTSGSSYSYRRRQSGNAANQNSGSYRTQLHRSSYHAGRRNSAYHSGNMSGYRSGSTDARQRRASFSNNPQSRAQTGRSSIRSSASQAIARRTPTRAARQGNNLYQYNSSSNLSTGRTNSQRRTAAARSQTLVSRDRNLRAGLTGSGQRRRVWRGRSSRGNRRYSRYSRGRSSAS